MWTNEDKLGGVTILKVRTSDFSLMQQKSIGEIQNLNNELEKWIYTDMKKARLHFSRKQRHLQQPSCDLMNLNSNFSCVNWLKSYGLWAVGQNETAWPRHREDLQKYLEMMTVVFWTTKTESPALNWMNLKQSKTY